MRGFDCQDGVHLHAEDDAKLLKEARSHSDAVHADQNFTDEQLRGFIRDGGYDDSHHATTG
jgi:hypothetical protein